MKYTIELTNKQKALLESLLEIVRKHIGFNAKLEPAETTNVEDTNDYKIGYNNGFAIGYERKKEEWEKELAKHRTEAYSKGFKMGYDKALEDVNYAIEVVKTMTGEECAEWFNDCIGLDEVICGFAVSRIIEIAKAYEEKKAEEEITKGDTVCFRGSPQTTFIVWDILDEADEGIFVYGFNQSGTYSSVNIKNVKKVNVPNRFDKITSILKELGE